MAPYDSLARFYNRDWGADYHRQIMSVLERLLLTNAPVAASILDVGCGTGQVAAQLVDRGFAVIGIDESAPMLEHARLNAPGARFYQRNARSFRLPEKCWSAISTFESLNHILDAEGLEGCFRAVYESVEQRFVFDLNRASAFKKFWNGDSILERSGTVCAMHSTYDDAERLGRCKLTLDGTHFEICQRCYDDRLVTDLLSDVGWRRIETFDAARDLQMTGDVALARTFFRCTK